MTLGSRIQSLRKKHGFIQEEMAELLGIQRSAYGHIENDRSEVSATGLIKIASKLKTTPNYLLEFTENALYDEWIVDIVQSPKHEQEALKDMWNVLKRVGEWRKR